MTTMKSKLSFLIPAGSLFVTAIRIWPSDRFPGIAVLAYVPSLLILITALVNIALRKRAALLNLLLIVVNIFLIGADNRQMLRPSAKQPQNSMRIFQWNIWGSRNGAERIAAEIRRRQPAIVCLNEPILHPRQEGYPPYDRLLGGVWQSWGRLNIMVLSRLPITRQEFYDAPYIKGTYIEVGNSFPSLLFLDVSPSFFYFRRTTFHRLSEFLAHRNPDVICGDFNTPGSAFSMQEAFLKNYKDAYFASGHGVGYTWPYWLPMVRIDVIYVRKPLSVIRYESYSSSLSDHRMQWIDIDLNRFKSIR